MLLSAVSVLVVAQSSSEITEGLMNNPVFAFSVRLHVVFYHLKIEFRLNNIYELISYLTEDIQHLGYKMCQVILFRKILDSGSQEKEDTKNKFRE